MYEKSVADVAFLNGEYERAAKLYYEGAQDGDELAAYNYAYCLFNGYGVERDFERARSFFTYARDMRGGEACYSLAVMYLEGFGVEKDYKKAIKLMTDSADLGCVEAMLYLGMVYTTGYVIIPDIIGICMIPYHKEVYRDMSIPMISGDVSEMEKDEELRFSAVTANGRMAFEYFRASAHHKTDYVEDLVAKGQYLYAKCYLDGMGTDFNRVVGNKIMYIAGKNGSSDAVEYLMANGITEKMLLADEEEARKQRAKTKK